MIRAIAVLIGIGLFLSVPVGAQQPLYVDLGTNVGMIESGVGRYYAIAGYVQSGQPDGFQFRLGGVFDIGHAGGTMTQIESLALINIRFGARLYLGAGIGVVGLTGAPGTGAGIPIIALAGLKTPPTGNFRMTVEGAFYYGFLPDSLAFRWGVGGTLSF